jgi:uncharacterized protein (DUF2344 family)
MSKSETLLDSINQFYEDPKNAKYLVDILDKKGAVSLRNLEWFITNYSKDRALSYKTSTGKTFAVHVEYKSSLKGYNKKLFDPFCRTDKFEYELPGTPTKLVTTVAQLNFIRWCIKNNVIDYITKNRDNLFMKVAGETPH